VGQDLEALSHGRRAGRTGHREALRTILTLAATWLARSPLSSPDRNCSTHWLVWTMRSRTRPPT